MEIGYEAIIRDEALQYSPINPVCISLLKDGTRELVWGITGNNKPEQYHTIRWFSDIEKTKIQKQIDIGDISKIQAFLARYI